MRLFALRRLGDVAAADDVARETQRRAIEALRARRVDTPAALSAFALRTVRLICLQYQRLAGREAEALHPPSDGESDSPTTSDSLTALVGDERRAAVRRALDALESDDRDLLLLIYHERLETDEVARRLAIPPGDVRARKHRALHRLSERLAESSAGDSSI